MLSLSVRERNFVRKLIAMGCPQDSAIAIGELQRKLWESRAAVETAKENLRLEIRAVTRTEPTFGQALQEVVGKRVSATKCSHAGD